MKLRPLLPGDDDEIKNIFMETIVMGQPLNFRIRFQDDFAHVSLGWYLIYAREFCRCLVTDDGQIVGYVLICADEKKFNRWMYKQTIRLMVKSITVAPIGLLRGGTWGLYWRRVADGAKLRRQELPVNFDMHAHVNMRSHARFGAGGLQSLRYVDEQAAILGFAGWYADINSKSGRRSASLERLGGQIIQRSHNRTLSWLAGESIERLRVVRQAALTEMKSAA
jgi:hypothetical protein